MPQRDTSLLNPFVIPGLQQLDIDPQLNPNYCFANFIEGDCNRLGRSAGRAIAKSPGKNAFNPLFIYGGSGLGKTHLAQAIGIEIASKFSDKIVLYVTANRFMTQYMDAVNVKNKLTDFLNFYQMIDVLILDDVQEFAEKQGTQNAFFHIFNHLHQSGKQLILTSDKAPVDLMGLEQRLLSRFKWGLSVELTPPSYNTRLEILKAKSLKDGIELPEDVLDFLASKVVGSVREIEGTLVSLIAHATLSRETITMDLAKRLTDKIVTPVTQEISLDRIQDTVCSYFGITRDLMLSKTRKREIVQARQIAMYLGRSLTKVSLAAIGAQKGGIGEIETIRQLAKKYGAEVCCSRIVADSGKLPYEKQVGLTGRTVCPKVYVAFGISGAVQHTCAIAGAGTVIAVNIDKQARIFDYADYGIIDDVKNITIGE